MLSRALTQTDAATNVRQMYSWECGKRGQCESPKPSERRAVYKVLHCQRRSTKRADKRSKRQEERRQKCFYLLWFPHLSLSFSFTLSRSVTFTRNHDVKCGPIYQHLSAPSPSLSHTNTLSGTQFPRWRGEPSERAACQSAHSVTSFTCKKEVVQGFCYLKSHSLVGWKQLEYIRSLLLKQPPVNSSCCFSADHYNRFGYDSAAFSL